MLLKQPLVLLMLANTDFIVGHCGRPGETAFAKLNLSSVLSNGIYNESSVVYYHCNNSETRTLKIGNFSRTCRDQRWTPHIPKRSKFDDKLGSIEVRCFFNVFQCKWKYLN